MTPSETAAFHAGMAHAADLALTAAVTIEIRDDADKIRQRAAVAALQALAEGLKDTARGQSGIGSAAV